MTVTLDSKSVTTFVLESTAVSNEGEAELPLTHQLLQNFPNPFNKHTAIGFSLSRFDEVRVDVFDLLGRRVATLLNGRLGAGSHQVEFDAGQLPSGVYVYQLRAGDLVQSRRMVVIR